MNKKKTKISSAYACHEDMQEEWKSRL